MKPMTEPRTHKTAMVAFVIPTTLLDQLDEHARSVDRSRSSVMRLAVHEFLRGTQDSGERGSSVAVGAGGR